MIEQMLPGVQVYVAAPTKEHQAYRDDIGCITDVKDFGMRRFCMVQLDQKNIQVTFEAIELQVCSADQRAC